MTVVHRLELRPAAPLRLPLMVGKDGVTRRRPGNVLERLLHHGGEPVTVRIAQPAPDRVVLAAAASGDAAARHGLARMRFAIGVDDEIGGFLREFADDPLIGASVRRRPWLRVPRRPEPFEALTWAVCEQLIEYDRAAQIQRRLVWRLGRRCERTGLRDAPAADRVAVQAPALLQSLDLAAGRSVALVRAAREIARGRLDLHDPDHETGWRRLRAIPGIGSWTVEMLALRGQGRYDQLPAGDLSLLKLVGRLLSGGDPRARADEQQVRRFFAPYGQWAGLAAWHALGAAAK